MKISITGASGHVGSCLCRELIKRGHQLSVLTYNNDTKGIDGLDVEMIDGDILNLESLETLFNGSDFVFHLAARIAIDKKDHDIVYHTNVQGTKNVIQACKSQKVKRLIHFSTIHVIQSLPSDKPIDERTPNVENAHLVYDRSKAEGEKIVFEAVKNGLDAVVVNPTAIIGPNDFQPSYLGQAIIKLYLNKLPTLVPGGYDWVDVRDIVNGAIAAMEKGRAGEKYILSGRYLTMKEFAQVIEKVTGSKAPRFVTPTILAKMGIPFIRLYATIRHEHPLYTGDSLDILNSCNKHIKNDKAVKELGYSSRPLEETIADTIEWYKKEGYLDSF